MATKGPVIFCSKIAYVIYRSGALWFKSRMDWTLLTNFFAIHNMLNVIFFYWKRHRLPLQK